MSGGSTRMTALAVLATFVAVRLGPDLAQVLDLHALDAAHHDHQSAGGPGAAHEHRHGDSDDHHKDGDPDCHHDAHCCCTHAPAVALDATGETWDPERAVNAPHAHLSPPNRILFDPPFQPPRAS